MTSEETVKFGKWLKRAIIASTAGLLILMGLIIYSVFSGQAATHETISDRLGNVERLVIETHCLAFIPEPRPPAAVAECRLPAESGN
jgi:hypothetical protein